MLGYLLNGYDGGSTLGWPISRLVEADWWKHYRSNCSSGAADSAIVGPIGLNVMLLWNVKDLCKTMS